MTSTEIWDGRSFTPGPELPVPMSSHCQVTINSTHIFVADIWNTLNVYLLNWETKEWEHLPVLTRRYNVGTCGVYMSEDNGMEIVIVGDGTSDIYTVDTLVWREGKKKYP